MAIRVSWRIWRLIGLSIASAMVGCTAQQQSRSSAASDLPAFRNPAQIRPTEQFIRPTPVAPIEQADTYRNIRSMPAPYAAWVPQTKARAWQYIVIHHSATPDGSAAKFDREHKAKGWDELGYHFVIDNGRGGPDGRVEVGPRWPKQKWGAHAKTADNRFNEHGIGICFVGNFENGQPTPKQMQSAAKLVAWLMQTYQISARNVIGHDDTKSTLCPGKYMNLVQIRTQASNVLAGMESSNEESSTPLHASVAIRDTKRELLVAQ